MNKVTDILDETEEPRPTLRTLATSFTMFTICPECGHVDAKFKTGRNHPCQKCGIQVECRRILFSTEGRLLEMIFECYQSQESQELCVLLFCALVEQHLLNLLKGRYLRVNIQWPVIKLKLERYERVHERLKLFERSTGVKMDEALAGRAEANVFTIYDSLRKKRNTIAHGLVAAMYAITQDDIKAAVNAAADSFSCFAFLHHNFCAVDSPPLSDS